MAEVYDWLREVPAVPQMKLRQNQAQPLCIRLFPVKGTPKGAVRKDADVVPRGSEEEGAY